jgi:SLBB domain
MFCVPTTGGRSKGPSSLQLLPSEQPTRIESLALNLPVASLVSLRRLRSQFIRRLRFARIIGPGAAFLLCCLIPLSRCEALARVSIGVSCSGAVVLNAPSGAAPGDNSGAIERVGPAQPIRAALIYIIGSVIRPGVVSVEPALRPTLVQALALAGGPTSNAALSKAILIREQQSGRTVTTLNLKRILRGEDPDVPIRDRDIVFIPWRRFRISGSHRRCPRNILRHASASIGVGSTRPGCSHLTCHAGGEI